VTWQEWIEELSAGRVRLLGGTLADIVKWRHAYLRQENGLPSFKCPQCDGRGAMIAYPLRDDAWNSPDLKAKSITIECGLCAGSGGTKYPLERRHA
jgi:hypothetical protein